MSSKKQEYRLLIDGTCVKTLIRVKSGAEFIHLASKEFVTAALDSKNLLNAKVGSKLLEVFIL